MSLSLRRRLRVLVLLQGAAYKSFSRSAFAAAGILNASPAFQKSIATGRDDRQPAVPSLLSHHECWDIWQANWAPIEGICNEGKYEKETVNIEESLLEQPFEKSQRSESLSDAAPQEFRVVKLRQPAKIKVNAGRGVVGKPISLRSKDHVVSTCSKICEEGQLTLAVEALALLVHRVSVVPYSLFYSVLKRCILQKDLELGRLVHALTTEMGYDSNSFLANHIIRMYASHGKVEEAMQVFSRVTAPDTFVWNSIISAYADNGKSSQAIELYRKMRQTLVMPNNYVFVATLKACACAADYAFGKEVHADLLASVDEPDAFVGSCLVDMYAKCSRLDDARRVFDTFPIRNIVTWTAMISGYADHGLGQDALALYAIMLQEGLTPDKRTFACLLKACGTPRDLHHGRRIHAQIQEQGLEGDPVVSSKLILMYAKCGSMEEAHTVLDKSSTREVLTWNAMLTGYLQHGLCQEAIALYIRMQKEGIVANRSTFACLLQACSGLGALHLGKELHATIQEHGLEGDVVIGNSLVNMYAKCGVLEDARKVFNSMSTRDAATWTAMLTGYAQHGHSQEALNLYASMQEEATATCDHFTFACLLKACAGVKALLQGKQLHAQIQERGLETDVVIGTALVDMYAKCGSFEEARRVFDSLPKKNVVTWNAMMAGYVQHEFCQEALSLYGSMQEGSLTLANNITFVCLLQACAGIAALHQGKKLYSEILKRGLETDVVVGTSLVDMFAKCGSLEEARRVFDRLCERNVVTWNALLNGYAHHSNSHMAIQCFEEMQRQGVEPDEATFISLLVACCHEGLVNEGRLYFRMMEERGIAASSIHYNCMVDLLGRSGQLHEAENMLRGMPFQKDVVGWTSLLNACKIQGDVELARRCFDHLIELEPDNAVPYVLIGNIYANAGRWSDVHDIETLRKAAGAWKKPAKACIEVKSRVHEFTVGEERADISSKLRSTNLMLKEEGHVPHTDLVLKGVSESRKEDALCGHAEKLALAYGLMNTPNGTTLLVTKNLRMCNDCHSGTKIMSRLEKREIIVKDAHRVHHFVDGACTCGDGH